MFSKTVDNLAYTFNMLPSLQSPVVMLRVPLLMELYGAGFTKALFQHYELRFPRITKIFRHSERSWSQGIDLKELDKVAREAIGRDRSDKDVDDWCNNLWGKPVSPGAKCSLKRKASMLTWEAKLAILDVRPTGKRRFVSVPKPLHVMTNKPPMSPSCDGPIQSSRRDLNLRKEQTPSISKLIYPFTELPRCPTSHLGSQPPEVVADIALPDDSKNDPISMFLDTALVWFGRSCNANRSLVRPLLCKRLVPADHLLHSLESLLVGCGWNAQDGEEIKLCGWVERGVIIIDTSESHGNDWRVYALGILEERRAMCANRKKGKPIWVFDATTLGPDAATKLESKVIYRLS